ncbi:MAG TPA: tRNA lysidine(34) synthetase TilS [Longimicrobiales bacterium]|nr:tRNA lysidine(34) synthetase TilS [Longimicrobiales bacterium]
MDPTTFAAHLRESALIRPGARIVVAVSGGRDSVALLHLLLALRVDWGLELIAVHLDHRMRPGSGADAEWLIGLCRGWSVPLVSACALRVPRSEAEARAVRYDLLRSAARTFRADAVATGHHRDDQAETVLLRIARGTGVRGLRGIAARRGRLVRPLLAFDRAAIDAWCAEAGLQWREDPTNRELRYARNRLRAGLMPALGGKAARGIAALAEAAGALEAAWRGPLDEMSRAAVTPTEQGFLIARDALARYDRAARARLIRTLSARLGAVPKRSTLEAALALMEAGSSGAGLDLGGGVRLERGLAELRLTRTDGERVEDRPARIESRPGSALAVVGGRRFSVDWEAALPAVEEESGTTDGWSALIGASALPLEMRSWRPGDRMRLAAGSRKLKKLFNDWRVERPERVRTPVLADASGRILWIPGRVAAVDAATAGEPLLRITVRDAELE